LENVKDDIVREVRETIRNLHETASRIELQEERAQEAARQLEISRLKFKYGMTNNFDLIDAESVLSIARTNVENARAQYIVGLYRLRAAMGTLLSFSEQAS
jgi:outer membrane protein TolC